MPKLSRTTVRLPSDVKEWLDARAERNAGSLNTEIVRAIREKMDQESRQTT